LIVIKKGWLQVNHYKTYGIAFFPLAFALLLLCNFFSTQIIVFATLTLAICDALAGIVGENFGKQKIEFLFEKKSIIGFLTFFSSSFFLSLIYFGNFSFNGILICFTITLTTSLTELFSVKGSDNLTVPIISAISAYFILSIEIVHLQELFILNILLISACYIVVKNKWLTISGAFAALWMAQFLFIGYNFIGFVAPTLFLFSGTLLSKLNKEKKEHAGRNAVQVFANGIVGIVCLILYKLFNSPFFLYCSLASFCISMADTCSSEIGKFFAAKTYDIIGFTKIPKGISGGISIAGTLGGLLAAFFITSICYLFYPLSIKMGLVIAVFGFIGMLIDSVLGSQLQPKFLAINKQLVEVNEPHAVKLTGFLWCNNDMVNLLSNLITTLLFYFYIK
jgi:uncharacterized protein (TIGR00297 family)